MLRTIGKTLGGAIAVMCLVSTLAMAAEMTCVQDDGKGNCTAATGPDGRTAIVVGAGLKAGEQIDCINRGTVVECRTAQVAPPVVMVAEMTCAQDDGKALHGGDGTRRQNGHCCRARSEGGRADGLYR
jgi:hypothetical protein